jgi:HEPN domain-containing protein
MAHDGVSPLPPQGIAVGKSVQEWLKQAKYDMDTARFMFSGGRYFYAVFMCHLSIEKALKGLLAHRRCEEPPRVHNLVYLLKKVGVIPPQDVGKFLTKLNEASVLTRYPEELTQLQTHYSQAVVRDILKGSKEALKWIRNQF